MRLSDLSKRERAALARGEAKALRAAQLAPTSSVRRVSGLFPKICHACGETFPTYAAAERHASTPGHGRLDLDPRDLHPAGSDL